MHTHMHTHEVKEFYTTKEHQKIVGARVYVGHVCVCVMCVCVCVRVCVMYRVSKRDAEIASLRQDLAVCVCVCACVCVRVTCTES